jgi:sugar phosphate isomerase/epimerase
MINYAVMTFMYRSWIDSVNGSHEALLNSIADAGADGVEVFCNSFMNNDKLLKLYQKELGEKGLKMPVMDLISNLACRESVQRKEAYEKMREGIDICDAMGAEIVHIAGCAPVEGVSPEDGRKLIAEGLMEFVDDVEKRGMILAFEDFDPSPGLICSGADCLEIIHLTGNRVKFVFDTGNFEAAGEHAEDNFNKMIEHTCHFHFKDLRPADNSRGYTGAEFGSGMVKNRQIAGMIKDSGYGGWVALESLFRCGESPSLAIPPALRLLKSWLE